MKILLLRCEESRSKYDFQGVIENEPLDLEIIYTLLKDKHDVTIFDKQVEKESVKKHLLNNHYDVLYVEARSFQESFALEYVHDFKQICKGKCIVGGQHAQLNYSRFYDDDVDYILCGYNYYDLDRIINDDIQGVNNLCYRQDNEFICNEFKMVEIDDLPLADRSYFYQHPDRYQYLDIKHAMWIRSAFSCPYRCKFCLRNKMNMSSYCRRSVLDLVNEIKINDNENVYIVDDDFLYDRNYIMNFIDLIKTENIKRNYICYGRSDFIAANEDIMKQFKEIGLKYVLVGIEDIYDNRLNDYNKLNNTSNNLKCIEICQKYDINLMAMFIIGLDFKTKDFYDLYAYIKKHHLRHVAVSIYTPEIGLDHDKEYISDNPCDFDYLHLVCKPDYLSVKEFYFHYYILLIRLFIKGYREKVYDFIDYGDYIRSFIKNIFKVNRNESPV